jgi:hypothetical protein
MSRTERYPRARIISTWNAAENQDMIAINKVMGFDVTAHSTYWFKELDPCSSVRSGTSADEPGARVMRTVRAVVSRDAAKVE